MASQPVNNEASNTVRNTAQHTHTMVFAAVKVTNYIQMYDNWQDEFDEKIKQEKRYKRSPRSCETSRKKNKS